MTTIKRTKDRQFICRSSFLLWSLYCLSFVSFIVVMVLSVLRPFYCGHCIVCPSSNEKDEGRTIQWPQWNGRSTDNTMITIKRTKDIQYNDHNEKDVLRPFYCGHCIVCPSPFSLWSLYCLSFVLFIVVIRKYNDHNKKDEWQTIQWPQ
jgi:hypothetical protein